MFILLCIFAVLTLGTRATHLSQLEQKFNTLEQKVRSLEQKEANSAAKSLDYKAKWNMEERNIQLYNTQQVGSKLCFM